MRLRDCVPLPLRRMFGALFSVVIRRIRRSPIDVVKSNTREAFDFFWAQDDFIDQCYLEPGRLDLYQLVAQYCRDVLTTRDCPAVIRVADIGCGTGHMLRALETELGTKCDVQMFGLDFASTAIDKAKTLLPQATFVAQDIYENSLPSDSFDLVLCIETLEHLRYPEKALLELLRICKWGGSIVLTVPNGEKDSWDGHVNFWTVPQFRGMLLSQGLVDIKLVQNDTVIMARLAK